MSRFITLCLSLLVVFSSCQKEISSEAGTPSAGFLQNDAGDCMPMNVLGNYIANKNLNDTNVIEVSVTVATPGSYTIFTDTVNGYYFRGQGSFANAGTAVVKLKGFGKPLVEGTDLFFVIYDSSFCVIPVTVQPAGTVPPPPPTGSNVYFPLTNNSWWSYDSGGTDTLKTTSTGNLTYAGKSYSNFITTYESGARDSAFYRFESGTNSYYRYQSTAAYAALITLPAYIDILFLKENLTTNATWNSDHSGTILGFPGTLRLKFTWINNNATMTVNGKNYTNVYHVRMQPQSGAFGNFVDIEGPQEFYYAKGIGLIKAEVTGMTRNIRYYVVN